MKVNRAKRISLLTISSHLLNDIPVQPPLEFIGTKSRWHGEAFFVRVASTVFALQALVLIGISDWLYTHFDLTWDFAIFYQAWYLIAHGNLNPYVSVGHSYFWQGHLEWIMWPLALLYYLYPHGLTLLIVQDLAIVGAEVAAMGLVLELIRRKQGSVDGLWWLRWLGLFVLLVNPWLYWSAIFDFHFHSMEAFFITTAVWQFYRHHVLRGYIFVALCFVTSLVSVTFLVPLALLLFIWRQRRDAIIVGTIAILGFLLEEKLFFHNLLAFAAYTGGVTSSHIAGTLKPSTGFSSLGGILHLPAAIVKTMWMGRLNIYANLGPSGLLEMLSPFGLFIPGLVLLESTLAGTMFSQPGTQNIPAYALLAVGTIAVLLRIATRSMRTSKIVAAAVVMNALAWTSVGAIGFRSRTAVPSAFAASTLQHLRNTIPTDAEVIASQGIVGRFAGRKYVYTAWYRGPLLPIRGRYVYFIISPYNGINVSPVSQELSRIAFLASQPHVKLLTHRGNIWAFRWEAPYGVTSFKFGGDSMNLPAWTMGTSVGDRVLSGSPSTWHMTNKAGEAGYIETGAYWRLSPARYQLSINVASTGPVNVEAWNSTESVLLLRRTLESTNGIATIEADFSNQQQYSQHVFRGWRFFPFQDPEFLPYDQIEVRVWTNGRSHTDLYNIGLRKDK